MHICYSTHCKILHEIIMFSSYSTEYSSLYNNQINARALIGQSAMVYCAGKPMEKSRVLRIII